MQGWRSEAPHFSLIKAQIGASADQKTEQNLKTREQECFDKHLMDMNCSQSPPSSPFLILYHRWQRPWIRETVTTTLMLGLGTPWRVWTLNLKSQPTTSITSPNKNLVITTAGQVGGNNTSQVFKQAASTYNNLCWSTERAAVPLIQLIYRWNKVYISLYLKGHSGVTSCHCPLPTLAA